MSLLTYVPSYADVRALLGVSEDELEDAVLGLDIHVLRLEQALQQVNSNLISAYEASAPASTNTPEQVRLFKAVQVFSTFFAAVELTASGALFAPKTISDGKALVQRQAGEPWAAVREGLLLGKSTALSEVKGAYASLSSGAVTTSVPVMSGLVVSSPSTDVVTG